MGRRRPGQMPGRTSPGGQLDILSVLSDISVMTEITDKTRNRCPSRSSASSCIGATWAANGASTARSARSTRCSISRSAPLTAEEIADTLGMARSNVSNSIKELLAWNLIRRVPILGDRRDHFEAETDIWEMWRGSRPAARSARSIRPWRRCAPASPMPSAMRRSARSPRKRLKEMLGFTETIDRWYAQMLDVPRPQLAALIRLGDEDRRLSCRSGRGK